MFAYKNMEGIHQLLKSRHLFVISFSWKSWEKKKKESNSIVSLYCWCQLLDQSLILYANIVFNESWLQGQINHTFTIGNNDIVIIKPFTSRE